MKTAKHLYPQIAAFENLYQAFKAAARGKRKKTDIASFEYDLEENLLRLRQELSQKSDTSQANAGAGHSEKSANHPPQFVIYSP